MPPTTKKKKTGDSRRKLDARECAEELDLSVEVIRDYMMRGCPHDKHGAGKANRLNPDEVAAWMRDNNLTGAPGRPADANSPSIDEAKLREINLRCRKHELDVAERERELVPASEIRQWMATHVGGWRNRVLGLAARLMPLMEGCDLSERHAMLEEGHIELLNELSAAITKLGSSAASTS